MRTIHERRFDMNEISALPPESDFKDRRAGLIVFGILQLLLGGLCALIVPLMFFGQSMSASMTGTAPNYRLLIPNAIIYGALAISFVWLGVGSIQCRRW